jgi:hypothetical protein
MNLNDFATEGQVWDGVKQVGRGLGSVAKGIGGVAAGVGTGLVKGLDMLGGGSGDVGTMTQRAERSARNEKKHFDAELKQYDRRIPTYAITEFINRLKEQQIDINNDKTYNRDDVLNQLRAFATEFYAADPGYDEQTKTLNKYMLGKIDDEPLPNTINKQTVGAYLTALSHLKKIGLTNIVGTTRRMQSQQVVQRLNTLAQQIVQDIKAGKQPAQNIIKQFIDTEQLQQQLYSQGVASAVKSDLQTYVDGILGTAPGPTTAAPVQSTEVPAAAPGTVNTITVRTKGGDRKFFIDRRDQWYEYTGNNWPNGLESSSPVSDDATVDFLAKQVADGRLRQEPYGSPKRRRT